MAGKQKKPNDAAPKASAVSALLAEPEKGADAAMDDAATQAKALKDKYPLPDTAAKVAAMSLKTINATVEAHNLAVTPWLGLALAEKKDGLIAYLKLSSAENLSPKGGSKLTDKAKVSAEHGANDPLLQIATEIEQIGDDQTKIEAAIKTLLQDEGVNDFKLGGLLQKLQEVATFTEAVTFKAYVAEHFGLQYRKAMYLISIYNTLLNAGISWDEFEGVGWTKIVSLLPILTKENVAHWVAQAKALNNVSLKAAVKAALEAAAAGTEAKATTTGELKTKTFKLAEDQLETVELALEDAKKKTGSDAAGFALDMICTEYLANTGKVAPKIDPETPKKLAAAEAKIAELTKKLAAAQSDDMPDLKAFYEHALKENGGDVSKTLETLFVGAFDEVFPGIVIEAKSAAESEAEAA